MTLLFASRLHTWPGTPEPRSDRAELNMRAPARTALKNPLAQRKVDSEPRQGERVGAFAGVVSVNRTERGFDEATIRRCGVVPVLAGAWASAALAGEVQGPPGPPGVAFFGAFGSGSGSDCGRGRLTTIWIVAMIRTSTVRMCSLVGISWKMA